ncbi:MAG: cellulase family glycosylhydrolase [Prevotella sp.]|nr:cellulase family glycosylhydrolase [Prevotella sp.]
MKRIFTTIVTTALVALTAWAQGVKPLPTLQVEGKWLTDMHGNHVVLHGVMDTPSAWFNSGRWGWSYDDAGRQRCLDYFEKVFTGLEKAKCTVFRLHLEPAWTNDPNITRDPDVDGKSGEANISQFSATRLNTYLKTLFFPLMQKAMNHGMYVVVRPPGVCPRDLKVGDYYNEYLTTVWNIVSQNDSIKKYAGQISLELANEPVNMKSRSGGASIKALHDFFQPIVNKIRQNGFTGIIWVPGTGWQSHYEDYATYPITGKNIGYAVHDYEGWYNCSEGNANAQTKINQFHTQVPVVDKYPIIITEVDWSPNKPGTGHYNEHGVWVESNYGTWATGSTSKWGKAFKACLDHYGNISMTLSGTDCLIDVEQLLKDGSVVPAFGGLEEACGKACMDWYAEYYKVDWPHSDNEISSVRSRTVKELALKDDSLSVMLGETVPLQLMATYQTGRTEDVSATATLQPETEGAVALSNGQLTALRGGRTAISASFTDELGNTVSTMFGVDVFFFSLEARYVEKDLLGTGGVYNEKNHALRPSAGGLIGWKYGCSADMSGYKYLVVKLRQPQTCEARLNIYTDATMTSGCYTSEPFGDKTLIAIDLSKTCYTSGPQQGEPLDTKNVRVVGFSGSGSGYMVVSDIYLTNNGDYSPGAAAISLPTADLSRQSVSVHTLGGQLVRRAATTQQAMQGLRPGLYIVNGRKYVVK